MRHAVRAGAIASAMALFAVAIFSSEVSAAYPANCKPAPGAIGHCTNKIPGPYIYHPLTCGLNPAYETEQGALAQWEASHPRCPGQTYVRFGWIPYGQSMTIGLDCAGTVSRSSSIDASGLEWANWLVYEWGGPVPYPACDSTQALIYKGPAKRARAIFCPRGYASVAGGAYCYKTSPSDLDVSKNLGAQCPTCGNPITPGTGNKYQKEVDYTGTGAFPLRFERHYNSLMRVDNRQNSHYGFTAYYDAFGNDSYHGISLVHPEEPQWAAIGLDTIGANWRHTYQRAINYVEAGANGVSTAFAYRQDGRVLAFVNYNGAFHAQEDINDRLTRLPDNTWKYRSSPDDEIEYYDANGLLVSIENRAGQQHTLSYDSAKRLIGVTDEFGRTLTINYAAPTGDPAAVNRIASIVDPAGNTYSYGYGANATLTSVTYPSNVTKGYTYDPTWVRALTAIVDESGQQYATFSYGDWSTATLSEHAGGADRVTVAYSETADHRTGTAWVTDAFNVVRTYTYAIIAGVSRNTGITQPAASGSGTKTSSKTYDWYGNVTSSTDFNGNRTCYAFDVTRNLETHRVEGFAPGINCPANLATYAPNSGTRQRKISTQWHATYRLPTQIDEPGKRTTFTHDASGNVLTKTELDTATSESRTWTYTYNSFGKLLTADGPRSDVSDVTIYTYYSCTTGFQCGQIETITNAAGHVTTYNTYNAHGQPLTITDPNGLLTTLTYDLRQRLTSRTVGSEQTTFDYWPTGLLKKATLPDGSFLEYTYDGAHRLTEIEDSEGNRIVYTLDAMGNRTQEDVFDPSSALTQTRTRVFNTLNQLWKEIGAAGTAAVTTTFAYDNNGNQTNINAPLARNTVQAYDELNRLKQVTDPLSGVTLYGYNALDQLISVTDPRSKVTTYTYNALGDLKQQASPDTGTTVNTYDSGGNVATSTDARSKTGTYAYDALNRVTSLTYPDQTIAYTYDAGTNQKGRLMQISDASGSTSWSYDTHGRVLTKQQTMGSISKTVGYAYDSFARLQTLTLPSGNTITYGYTDGKVTTLTLNGSTTILSNVLYSPFGPPGGWTWGNATLAVREYDTDGKITDVDSAGLKTYSYDDAFRITGITDASDPNLSQSYSYDLLDRLTSATGTNLNQGWTYDANGNRLTQTGSQPSTYTISSANNRMTSIAGSLTRTYGYDNAGNTTSDGTATFAYNDAGRMVSATKAGVTTSYSLNAFGQRVKKSTGGSLTYFAYDEAGHLLGEYDTAGNLVQETVWFGDTPVAVLKPNGGSVTAFYIHTDHLNTPRRVSRPSDNVVVWRWDADPFGAAAAHENPDGDTQLFTFNLRLPGQYLDSETGLHYNYRRDYDPAIARYVESDPLGMVDSPSTYAYVRNHPIGLTDRYGLMSDDECCMRSQELGQNGNAQGWVICCEGRKVPCSFAVKAPTKADTIRRKCTIEHEKSHLPEIECNSCTKDPVRPDRSGPGAMDYNLSECTAGKRGLDCYRRSIRECGTDEQCRKEIQDSIARLTGHYRKCWGGI